MKNQVVGSPEAVASYVRSLSKAFRKDIGNVHIYAGKRVWDKKKRPGQRETFGQCRSGEG